MATPDRDSGTGKAPCAPGDGAAIALADPSDRNRLWLAEAGRADARSFSDPQKVKEMQEQARALQKRMQEQQQTNAKSNAKKADDLEKELGL
jgi:hypothetical protein